jgi:hypothetical protein
MKPVRFLSKVNPYNAGEVAGFRDDVANGYIKLGLAEPFTEGENREEKSDVRTVKKTGSEGLEKTGAEHTGGGSGEQTNKPPAEDQTGTRGSGTDKSGKTPAR